ncbi:hypothetical protein ACIPYQ_25000 [Streptomyces sp. NPDC090045]|uniref:hypothetical protein n=1 Tax=Streptomyces sp. NPDC090045 TaxID=3365927 RepID=UPI003817AA6E
MTWLEGAPRAGVPVEPPAGPLAGPEARLWTAPEHGDGAAARGGSPTSAGPAVPSALAPTPAPSEPVAESWAGAPVLPRRASGAALPAQRAGDMGQGEPWADGPGLPGEPGDEEERPVLPRRRAQQHLAPQLREAPVPRPATDAEQPLHDPGLMAAFQRGFGLAQSENQL